MTDYTSLLFNSVTQLHEIATTEAACRGMVEFVVRLGFDRVIVCSSFPRPGEDELIDELFLVHDDWAEGRSTQERDVYLLHCPVTWHTLELDEPFFRPKSPLEDPVCMVYHIVRGVRNLGQVSGMQVPVFGRSGLEDVVPFASERLDLNASCKFAAQTFCPTLFFALKHLRGPVPAGDAQALNERGQEVLQWIALDKQQAGMAAILTISERTVENRLHIARCRLDAMSTAQAVMRALRLGDIEV